MIGAIRVKKDTYKRVVSGKRGPFRVVEYAYK